MDRILVPATLPDCALLHMLADKINARRDVDFNFFGKLDDLHKRVSQEVRQINVLFPEYTPHDDLYHLSRLFHVADTLLGNDRFNSMNSAELFILAISLYGHDWGMAISEEEKQFIISGEMPAGAQPQDFWLLPDEKYRFAKFLRSRGLSACPSADISIEIWREYVRETHAFRSGERVRRFFEHIDGSIADAASRVCEGHWLNFEELQHHDRYPVNYSALREVVNLRAVSVYLRLCDMFDLAEDRTPYVIWKFVAPRQPRSKMEWSKHRALRPATCPSYQSGRIIQVDGSTDSHEVYAALEDLRIWAEDQLRGCNDILARMNDDRHKLDIYHIDWRVAARGFNPISIKFEFERQRMFEILGDEIYQNDHYVFLRELLQNSIDAIRLRKEVMKKYAGINPDDFGMIEVNVEHQENCDAIITWIDNGIGMDEYIVRNYLAVAGKSFYTSEDFQKEGLNLDPISRFGIGILSCFMLADQIEIQTYKDPHLPPGSQPLKITIPDVQKQFRIETFLHEVAKVGTTIKVFVSGRKIPLNDIKKKEPLNVTAYLSAVAGFVEIPILITEGSCKTIVLHPKHNPDTALSRFGKDWQV